MARNGTGTYLLPTGINPVTDGTVIDANWANTTLNDVATALTGSLPRDGQAPMTGTLKLADGNSTNPGIAWNSDGATGFFRPATNSLAITAGGVEQVRWTNGNQLIGSTADTGERLQVTGTVKIVGALTGSSTATFTGAVTAPSFVGALTGNASSATNVAWTGVTGKPTTIAGYGITDVNWTNVAGKPTTIAGYGITDHSFNNLLNRPTTLAGYGITDHNFSNLNGLPERYNWANTGTAAIVVGQLAWTAFSNGHTIFDASNSKTPQGTTVSQVNSQVAWSAGLPVLMGWNGVSTHGVRVDASRTADYAGQAGSMVGNPTLTGIATVGRVSGDQGGATFPTYGFKNDGDSGMYSGGDGHINFSLNGQYGMQFTPGGNISVVGNYYGGGAGLTGYAASFTAGNTNSVNGALDKWNTWSGVQTFRANKGNNVYGGGQNGGGGGGLTQFLSDDGGCSGFSFHRAASNGYAVHMTLDPDNIIRIGGWSAPAARHAFDMDGNYYAAGNISAFSDARLKKNWIDAPADFVERWAKVTAGTYDRTDQELTQVGVVAQDVQAILPHAVTEDKDGMFSLNYGGAAAVATVELAKELVELRKRFDEQAVVLAKLMEKFE